jgi:ADP-ribose pyrophosphatase YjhB (NUDIX family)
MEIFTVILGNPYILIPFCILVFLSVLLVGLAFYQGREISIWPPKIGPKPLAIKANIALNSINEQAAAVCYRKNKMKTEYLLVQTSGRRWTFPKGRIIGSEAHSMVAEKNALEEAGVVGAIQKSPFCTYRHWKQELKITQGQEYLVYAFLLEVSKQQEPIEEHRYPTWFTHQKAAEALAEKRTPEFALEFKKVLNRAEESILFA